MKELNKSTTESCAYREKLKKASVIVALKTPQGNDVLKFSDDTWGAYDEKGAHHLRELLRISQTTTVLERRPFGGMVYVANNTTCSVIENRLKWLESLEPAQRKKYVDKQPSLNVLWTHCGITCYAEEYKIVAYGENHSDAIVWLYFRGRAEELTYTIKSIGGSEDLDKDILLTTFHQRFLGGWRETRQCKIRCPRNPLELNITKAEPEFIPDSSKATA